MLKKEIRISKEPNEENGAVYERLHPLLALGVDAAWAIIKV